MTQTKESDLKYSNAGPANSRHIPSPEPVSARPKSDASPAGRLLSLQKAVGNRGVQRLFQSGTLTAAGAIRRQEESEEKLSMKGHGLRRKEPEKEEEGGLKVSRKLTVGPAKDRYEDEADRVAKAVSTER